jgi:hypothetical protein
MKTRRLRLPPESVTSRSSKIRDAASTTPLALRPASDRNRPMVRLAIVNRHCASTCSAELRAPVSTLARRRAMPRSGNANHSRQPSTIIPSIRPRGKKTAAHPRCPP